MPRAAARRRVVSMPPAPPKPEMSHVLKVRIGEELLLRLRVLAEREHRSLSEQVRFLLDRETQDRAGG